MDSRAVAEQTYQNHSSARAIWINVNNKKMWRREDNLTEFGNLKVQSTSQWSALYSVETLSLPGKDQDGLRATAVPRMSVAYPRGLQKTAPPRSLVTSYCRWLEGATALLKLRVRPTILLTAWDLGHRSSSKLQTPGFPLDRKKKSFRKRLKIKKSIVVDFTIK